MKKIAVFFGVILLLCLTGRAWFLFTKQHASTAKVKASITVKAEDLYAEYQKNETEANHLFLDKVIEVKGVVADVLVTGNTVSIQLSGSSAGGISCSLFPAKDKSQLPVKGSHLTIKGKCSGYLMDVNLVDCVVVK